MFGAYRSKRAGLAALLALPVAAAAVIGLVSASPASAHPDHENAVTCRQYGHIPVALVAGQPASYTVAGELCTTAAERRAGTTVQLLVHGATYNHDYWDFGTVHGVDYSYARDVAARGIATFAVDEIGAGASSRPASSEVTIQAAAYVAHQLVHDLRDGSATGTRFRKVVAMGHSLGSVVVWQEAISYGDVDGVIVTGAAHSLSVRFQPTVFHSVTDDPAFAASGLDAGYLTTVPGVRGATFYHTPDADPAVIARDEATKDVLSGTEIGTGLPIVTSTVTRAIHVPVLTILGSQDLTTCGPNTQGGTFQCSTGAAVAAQEKPFYSADADIHGCVVPGAGHGLSLALNNRVQVLDAVAWTLRYVDGHHGDRLPHDCG